MDEDFPVVCDNGCPEGYQGKHKFSCEWSHLDGPRYPDITVQITGEDGNIFFIGGRVRAALKQAGHGDQRANFTRHLTSTHSFSDALDVVEQWVVIQ